MARRPLVVALSAALACAGEERVPAFTMRDSAGVEIAESAAPAWDSAGAWRIDPAPLLSIGTADASADYQFTRVVGAVRFEDGTVAVGDAGTSTVRVFDASGRIVRTVGGPGSGPGEFGAMQSLQRSADSLDVLDRRRGRITVFDRAGNLVRTWQPMFTPFVAAYRLANGRWLASPEEGFFGGRFREDATPGLHRFPSVVVILDSTGAVADTLGAFPGSETAYYTLDGQPGSMPAAFGRTLRLASDGQQVYVTTGDRFGYDVHRPDGTLRRSVRSRGRDLSLPSAEAERFRDAILDGIANETVRDAFRRAMAVAEVPVAKAPVGRILVDPLGHAWLSEYENELMPAAAWFVFDSTGRYLGNVSLPPRSWLMEVGERHVVTVGKDDNRVESVRVHSLDRSRP